MNEHYIMDSDGNVIPATLMEWARFIGSKDKIIKQENAGPYWISTVFLGIDHGFGDKGPPILFETMAFKDGHEHGCERYCTREEAIQGHTAMVAKALAREIEE